MTSSPRPRQTTLQQLGPYMTLGFQLAITTLVFGGLGWLADEKLGTTPWLMVVGLILGATGGMISVIRTALRSSPVTKSKSKKGDEEEGDPGEHNTSSR